MLHPSRIRRFLVLSHDGGQAIAVRLVERSLGVLWRACILKAPGIAVNPKNFIKIYSLSVYSVI